MITYSREFLLSFKHWWKFQHQTVRLPLSTASWTTIKTLNLLRPMRGKRSGVRRHPAVNSTSFSDSKLQNQSAINSSLQMQDSSIVNSSNMPFHSSEHRNLHNLIKVNKATHKPGTTSFPKLFLSNARSMVNKTDDIACTITNNNCDIVVITESWLSSNVTDQLISIPGYATCRRDRPNDQRGGGICTFIKSTFNFNELPHLNDPDIESQWFIIRPHRLPRGINSIILATVYHPPQSDNDKLRSHLFHSIDSSLTTHPNSGIIVLGDFNHFIPGNLCSSFKLKKLVSLPTRGNNILDEVFSSLSKYYNDALILPPVGLSDHSCVILQPSNIQPATLPTTRVKKRICKAANKRVLFSSLKSTNWNLLYCTTACEDQFNLFHSKITKIINACLPVRSIKLHPTDKPWMTAEIKDAIKKRQRAWAKGNTLQYNKYRNKVTRLCKRARFAFYNNSIKNMQETNPKKWWDNIKLLSGLSKPSSLTSVIVDGEVLKDSDLAEALNDYFSNVASDIQPLDFTPFLISQPSDEYVISPESVERALLSIQVRKSNGPDDIPNWVLKNFASVICRPICSVFNSSINQGHVPSLWKCANVIPINKVPRPTSINSDFRPISLTPVLSKILEGFVFEWLAAIIMPHIDPYQYGCVKKSSTTHALVHLIHQWLSATETPKSVIRSCLIDFSKAFDRIDHAILLHKLQLLNTPQLLLTWCAHFLYNRQQHVLFNNVSSSWKHIHAGVPQGTKLGPLFFLVMVNDLWSDLPLYKYVDDCTIYEVLFKAEPSVLQNELNKIIKWSESNNMKINVTKTKELSITFLKNGAPMDRLTVYNQPLDLVPSSKLLGVYVSSDLKWSTHIDYICTKASKRLYALRTL